MENDDFIFIDQAYLDELKGLPSVTDDFLHKLKKLVWNVWYFQKPLYRLREEHHLHPYFGISEDQGERAEEYERYYETKHKESYFPTGFEEAVWKIYEVLLGRNLIESTKTNIQFLRTFSYFGLLNKHPDLPQEEVILDPNEYLTVTNQRLGKRTFRYEATKFGIFIEVAPSHTKEDVALLFDNPKFDEIRFKASFGQRPTEGSWHEEIETYRELFLATRRFVGIPDKEFLIRIADDPRYAFLKRKLNGSLNKLKNLRIQARKHGYLEPR